MVSSVPCAPRWEAVKSSNRAHTLKAPVASETHHAPSGLYFKRATTHRSQLASLIQVLFATQRPQVPPLDVKVLLCAGLEVELTLLSRGGGAWR